MAEDSAVRVHAHEESPVRRRLEVEVDTARVQRAFERAYRDLARRAQVRGFRPGKVPRAVLESLYGPQVREEIERQLVSESLPEAVEQAGLRPVTEPAIDAEPPALDQPFRYTAHLEVKPEIELPELEGLPARRPKVEVGDADVLSELEKLRERQAQLVEESEGTPAARGHVLRVDFVGRIDGQPFEGGAGTGVAVEIGSDRFVPGFTEQLEGARAGDAREVRVTFPAEYGNAELAGKEAVFEVQVHAVQRRELPELDDEFAKDLGDFESLEALRTRIRDDLRAMRDRESEATLRASLLEALVNRTRFEVPPGLVERRLERQLARAHDELHESLPHDALHAQLDSWRESWRPRAERDVREALLLEAVVRKLAVEVGEEELSARIDELAGREGVDAARLRRAYREGGELRDALRAQLCDEKALAFLASTAKIDETSDS
jgi:trigger factor